MASLAELAIGSSRGVGVPVRQPSTIIEFIESPWGLNPANKFFLFPVQRIILKAHYGLVLDDNPYGFPLGVPIPTTHTQYDPSLVDVQGLYKYGVPVSGWERTNPRVLTEAEYLAWIHSEGRCNIGTVIAGDERREMVLAVGRRSGKCVTGDTLVLTDRGVFRMDALDDPDGAEYQPLEIGVAQEGSSTRSTSKFFYNGGVKPIFKLRTQCGYKLGGTGNHRVKVMTPEGRVEWAYLADIREGDQVAIHRGTELWPVQKVDLRPYHKGYDLPCELDATLGLLLGSLLGDPQSEYPGVYIPDLLLEVFGKPCFTPESRQLIRDIGWTRDPERVPWSIMQSPASVVCSFLRGLFSGGTTLRSTSDRLVHEVQILLLNLGIVSRVQHETGCLTLCVHGLRHHQVFAERVLGDATLEAEPKANADSLDATYFFDPVVSVESGEAPVYDLNVPDGSMFVANGMTNHNTTISACIAAYETYKLVCKGNPQAYYGLPTSNGIQIISVATDKDQAALLYQEVSGHFKSCDFFGPYTANNTMSYARFQTPFDVDQFGSYADDKDARASIRVTFRSCIAKGLRGAGNIVIILDEFAHFKDAGQSSGDAVYDAVTPSASAFSPKDPRDSRLPTGPSDGRVITISSPLGREGPFYNLFQTGMTDPRAGAGMLCVQAPTWEVNPGLAAADFAKFYAKNPAVFYTEFGAEFSDRTRGWLDDEEDLLACVYPEHRPTSVGSRGCNYFMGLDIGLTGDGTAAVIGHHEGDLVVIDAIEEIKAGSGKFLDANRLDFEEVADWVYGLTRRFRITDGIFDQWHGIAMEQALIKRGVKCLQSVHMTQTLNSQIFSNFKNLLWAKRLMFFNWPITGQDPLCPYLRELMELQAEYKSDYVVKVAAPKQAGKHDDVSDALVRMVWCATKSMAKINHIVGAMHPGAKGQRPRYSQEARIKASMGGSHPSRMVAKSAKQARTLQRLKGW